MNEAQFSVFITVVILIAVAPTMVAQRFFQPLHYMKASQSPATLEPAAETAGLAAKDE